MHLAAAVAALSAPPPGGPAAVGSPAWAAAHAALETLAAAAAANAATSTPPLLPTLVTGGVAATITAMLVTSAAWRGRAARAVGERVGWESLQLYACLRSEPLAATLLASLAASGASACFPPPPAAAAAARWAAARVAWLASPGGRSAAARVASGKGDDAPSSSTFARRDAETSVAASLAALGLLRSLALAARDVPPALEAALVSTDPLPSLASLLAHTPWERASVDDGAHVEVLGPGGWTIAEGGGSRLPEPAAHAWLSVAALTLDGLGARRDWGAAGGASLAASLASSLDSDAARVGAALPELPSALAPLLSAAAAGRAPPPDARPGDSLIMIHTDDVDWGVEAGLVGRDLGRVASECARAMVDAPPDGGLAALVTALEEAPPAVVAALEGGGRDGAGDAVVTVWGVETNGGSDAKIDGGAPAAVWAPAVDGGAPVERVTVEDGKGGRVAGVRRRLKVRRMGGREGRKTDRRGAKTDQPPFPYAHSLPVRR